MSFHFLGVLWHMEFLGQGSDLSCSCDLSHSYGSVGSLAQYARLGIEPVSQHSQDASDPIGPRQELQCLGFLFLF